MNKRGYSNFLILILALAFLMIFIMFLSLKTSQIYGPFLAPYNAYGKGSCGGVSPSGNDVYEEYANKNMKYVIKFNDDQSIDEQYECDFDDAVISKYTKYFYGTSEPALVIEYFGGVRSEETSYHQPVGNYQREIFEYRLYYLDGTTVDTYMKHYFSGRLEIKETRTEQNLIHMHETYYDNEANDPQSRTEYYIDPSAGGGALVGQVKIAWTFYEGGVENVKSRYERYHLNLVDGPVAQYHEYSQGGKTTLTINYKSVGPGAIATLEVMNIHEYTYYEDGQLKTWAAKDKFGRLTFLLERNLDGTSREITYDDQGRPIQITYFASDGTQTHVETYTHTP